MSFPWIAFEALDFDTPNTVKSFERKFLNELTQHSVDPVTEDSRIYQEYYSDFDLFCGLVQIWLEKEEVYRFTSSALIRHFLKHLAAQNVSL